MNATEIETRVTDWKEAGAWAGPWWSNLRGGGVASYRVWQQFDGMRWFQRHEWRSADGSTEMGEWIRAGAPGWLPHSTPATVQE